ncbi:polysaccharide lyase family 4 protein [Dothidotthia symphoricarpi CBS 119687]|uniref:rhamnogalacturonan endolyase n=1 Tax=Dothidotthia symphoricarpi CBS 119687 TaxID=1392245 RepID=A0A6A6AIV3_9PLEO|nr:polysaccharide lyase family 4 protein [Dothidotthia symphoricarpi CBS 119687]KAF2131025.1 polysaccharide lyase family 4 protein [Dothidotthia symphoricarpi CBS 119687]
MRYQLAAIAALLPTGLALFNATQNNSSLTLSNDRLVASVSKSKGAINVLTLDGQNLLGKEDGSTGIGPYLDCYCIPSPGGFWTPGRGSNVTYELFHGVDSTGKNYGGISMGETYIGTGQRLEQYWFLKEGETGLHTFSRVVYHNKTSPFLRNLQELRTMFRPNHDPPLFTHFVTNEKFAAPRPDLDGEITVQDATWKLANPTDPYVTGVGEYFTKYTFQDTWRNHRAHGMYADGSGSSNGSSFGAWLVMNTVETYFGGPLHSDLVVDGIVYNYLQSNHHGMQTPNITDGFDRTFGPQYYHFNKGGSLDELRRDAEQYGLNPNWNADFYDSISKHVPNLVPSAGRGKFEAKVNLPKGAKNGIAILTQSGVDFQDNVYDTKAYQYWHEIPQDGRVNIERVKAGKYRLTVYADAIFGDFIQDGILVSAGKTTTASVDWSQESAGNEIFRIGTPDKSSGEYRHGYAPSPDHPLLTEEYRLYWGAYDFVKDFPEGVEFKVGRDDPATALNVVHWSSFGGQADYERPEPVVEKVNNWTILFDASAQQLRNKTTATFTVQLAGFKSAAGNTDIYNASEPYSNLPYTVNANGKDLEPWVLPYYQSSSCIVRSAVICYNVRHKFEFDTKLLKQGENRFVLSLPYNATNYESALLPTSVYVQYDAMRLEVK